MTSTKKIRAGALQFVLFIGAIVAILLLSFVLVSYSHNLFLKKTDVWVEVIQAADSGLERSFDQDMNAGATFEVPVMNDSGISVSVEKEYWGVLEIRKVKSEKGKMGFEKWAFVGHADEKRYALYLQDHQRPLVLAGNTKITGTAFLPEKGVKMGNIYGNSYYAPKLIYGEKRQSQASLPVFDPEIREQIEKLTSPIVVPKGEEIILKKGMVHKHSFKKPTQIIKGTHIQLEQVALSGNIMVWASDKIMVGALSKLHDVLLVAPHIEIEKGFLGNLQALASESITVGEGCQLGYPTVLWVHQEIMGDPPQNDIHPNIMVDSYAHVRGVVIFQSKGGEANRFKPHVKIDENAKVVGEVYCSENLELKGSVHGSVTTGGFVALENGNSYQNHLYNGSINSSLLPMKYAGIEFEGKPINQVTKWLY
ncbi:hypothetical protein [Allomuricauda sp. SCSIO 65647]|uniref:hypothetical protein n=1 Tax=Allomuricauda sp. SCSIO 65647 TaxID=2908843 RepID=UPI001F2F9522|nr:hypothetical protein [Muricauda sp. SCSIO 65647]UJH68667.1 hypothetical protein L0P89_05490 [Muricauda sp. SCSIO 65647]